MMRLASQVVAEPITAGLLAADTKPELFAATLCAVFLGQYGLCNEHNDMFGGVETQPPTRQQLRASITGALLGAFAP